MESKSARVKPYLENKQTKKIKRKGGVIDRDLATYLHIYFALLKVWRLYTTQLLMGMCPQNPTW